MLPSLMRASLYFILVMESSFFGAGLGRLSQGILFDLINSGHIGYNTQLLATVSIPFFIFDILTLVSFCLALISHKPNLFIPYLVWRGIKNLLYLTAILIVFLLGLRERYAGVHMNTSELAIGVWITHVGVGLVAFVLVHKAQTVLRHVTHHTKYSTRSAQTMDWEQDEESDSHSIFFPISKPVAMDLVDHTPNRVRMQKLLERYV